MNDYTKTDLENLKSELSANEKVSLETVDELSDGKGDDENE